MSALFGPAGNSDSFSKKHKSSLAAPKWISEFGLDCYEYQCGKGVKIREDTARKLGENAKHAHIALSLHAPYFINLANPEPESIQKTIGYILSACQAATWMGANRVVIHTGALMKRSRQEALSIAKTVLPQVLTACDQQGYGHIALCPETMGKLNQLGDLDEVLELCTLDERLIPCVDFGHLYARSLGVLTGKEACVQMLDRMAQILGEERASKFHSHFSHIEFTQKLVPVLENGRVINVSSMASFGNFPFISPYCASKRALDIFFNAFSIENHKNIKVISIKPGVIATPIWEKSVEANLRDLENCVVYKRELEFLKANALKNTNKGLDVCKTAKIIKDIAFSKNPKTSYTIGRDAKFAQILSLFPQDVVNRLVKFALEHRITK